MPQLRRIWSAAVTAVAAVATHAGEVGGRAIRLRPEADLTSGCFDFPANSFDRKRSIKGIYGQSPNLLLEAGQPAIDFTLYDHPSGNAWNLREQLEAGGEGKPVVLIWGMYTCPAFQGMGDKPPIPPWDSCGYRDEYDLVEAYKDRATFVHLYGPEPHPVAPGTNFDHGVAVNSYWSTVRQPTSYQERLDMVDRVRDWFHPDEVVLPDYLPGNPYSELIQPVWCSYGLGARPATIIAPDGSVLFQQLWLHTGRLAHELNVFFNGDDAVDSTDQATEDDQDTDRPW